MRQDDFSSQASRSFVQRVQGPFALCREDMFQTQKAMRSAWRHLRETRETRDLNSSCAGQPPSLGAPQPQISDREKPAASPLLPFNFCSYPPNFGFIAQASSKLLPLLSRTLHRHSPSTLPSSGVIVAHLTPTPYFLIASADSIVTLSSVASRFWMERSKYLRLMDR